MEVSSILASRRCSPAEAIAALPTTGRVVVAANAGEPATLVGALADAAERFNGLEVVQVLSLGSERLVAPPARGHLRVNALFIGPTVRQAVADRVADYTPLFLSEVPRLFRPGGALALDAALVQLSPPDADGHCSLGVSVDVMRAAVDHAGMVIAEINPRMPKTRGAAAIHVSRISHIVDVDRPLSTFAARPPDQVRLQIARHVAELIDDGCTIQAGVGTVAEAVMRLLGDRRGLGLHTEVFSDGMRHLVESGVATGVRKALWPGKAVASLVLGSEALYRWIDDNPALELLPSDITNDPARIARHDKVVAINSALSIDLTGQVNSDSIGTHFYAGIGGQIDFLRGAARSEGGRPVIALPSTARGGALSRIVATLPPGTGVLTNRGDVHWVATEFGRANLHGLSIARRARALLGLAHPRFREALASEAHALGLL